MLILQLNQMYDPVSIQKKSLPSQSETCSQAEPWLNPIKMGHIGNLFCSRTAEQRGTKFWEKALVPKVIDGPQTHTKCNLIKG